MANRRIEVHEIRHAIMRMRLGDSDRQIKKAGLIGRSKASELRKLAAEQGWLDENVHIPPNETIAQMIKQPRPAITQSLVTPYAVEVLDWANQGLSAVAIHQALVRNTTSPASTRL